VSEFQPIDLSYGPADIRVRVNWLLVPGGGAIRVRDEELWERAQQCRRCRVLGYDRRDIDAVLEAQRLGIEHAPCVAPCASCDAPTCDGCADATGTMCRPCYAEGPDA